MMKSRANETPARLDLLVQSPRFRPFRLVSTLEVETELFGEVVNVRLEVFRDEAKPSAFRLRLFRTALVQSAIVEDEDEQVEPVEWQTLEDFTVLLAPEDTEFEAASLEEAERRSLEALKRRVYESAWSKAN